MPTANPAVGEGSEGGNLPAELGSSGEHVTSPPTTNLADNAETGCSRR
jgi:hypothetical protein